MTESKSALLRQLRLALNDLEDREYALYIIERQGIYDTSIPEARVNWEQDRVDTLIAKLSVNGVQVSAPVAEMKSAETIAGTPDVDKALSAFIDEDTWENAVELVQAILDASKQTDNLAGKT